MPKLIMLFAILSMGPVVAAAAEEAPAIVRGTDGLTAVPFAVTNRTDGPMACGAAIAHWYSMPVGEAAPGGTVNATLWSDPETGAVFLLGPLKDRMPVLSLWCGHKGSDVSTGRRILLERRAGQAEPAIALACRAVGDKPLDCTPPAGP